MNTPITFRDVAPSPALEALVREKADKLAKQFDHVTTCRVTISRSNRHHRHGDSYHVRVDIHVPQVDLVAEHGSGDSDDLYATVDGAFEDARRRLKTHYDRARERRNEAR
jgi:ribosomal subunit interface protein